MSSNASPELETESIEAWRAMAVRCAVCTVAALAGWWLESAEPTASVICHGLAYAAGAWDIGKVAWSDFRKRVFDTHFLMLLVVPATVLIGAWAEGALLLILFSLAATLESFAMGRSRKAITALLRDTPRTALVVSTDGSSVETPITDVTAGMKLRVLAGQLIPVDMRLTLGVTTCDESSLTGEAIPVPKQPGDSVMSGTLNLDAVIEGIALRAEADSTRRRIVELVTAAQQSRAPSQRLADRFGSQYTLVVLAACTGLFLWSWLKMGLGAWQGEAGHPSAFYRAMTLLVVMSPCALVLAVPAAILSAIAYGARHGLIFRDGAAIETLADIKTVALDKTGTLTLGRLQVEDTTPTKGDAQSLLALAAAIARDSTHPISRAIAKAGLALKQPAVADIRTVPGLGMTAMIAGSMATMGSRDMLRKIVTEPALEEALNAWPQPSGTTEVWLHHADVAGRLLLRDTVRPEARSLLSALHESGVQTCMLTGDRAEAAQLIASATGVGSVLSGLKPADKVAAIHHFQANGQSVAMIGDGVNDAPCLAAANVSVAMGMNGSDAAIEQADVVLMNDSLAAFLTARQLSERVRRVMHQNLFIAIGTMVIMACVTLFALHLPLSISVAAHEGSTAVVVLNGLRLLTHRRSQSPLPALT